VQKIAKITKNIANKKAHDLKSTTYWI